MDGWCEYCSIDIFGEAQKTKYFSNYSTGVIVLYYIQAETG